MDGPYSVGIIGTGRDLLSVGWQVAAELCRFSELLERLYLVNRTQRNAAALQEYLTVMVSQRIFPLKPIVTLCTLDELVEAEPLVTFISLDASSPVDGVHWRERVAAGASRDDFLAANLPAIYDCAAAFNERARRYAGRVLVCTNPIDILTYFFLRESGLDASLVAGFNEGDRERFRRILLTEFQKGQPLLELTDVDAWVIGTHNEYAVPVFSNATIAGYSFTECEQHQKKDPTFLRASLRRQLIGEAGRWMHLLGSTSPEIASCMMRVIEAAAHDSPYQPSLSVLTSYNQTNVCIGQRVSFRNGIVPVPMVLEHSETEQYHRSKDALIRQLMRL
ncbi:MAG: hypothetical protein Q7R76_04800 [Candidatus Woesearchaeota archaeon]|nr:hypothetical protein [Candidatus Woesearchaeota archaeon]